MKKNILLLSAAILLILSGSAMSLTNFWYNGYAINNYGQILPATAISVRITISNSGGTLYQETHSGITTDQFGGFYVEVGAGTVVSGNLGTITTTADTRIKSETRVGTGLWVTSTSATLTSVVVNNTIIPGFIQVPEDYVIIGDAGGNGEALPVGGDLTGTNSGTAADFQINPSTVGSTEIIDNSIVDADINTAAAIQVTKLQSGAANQFLVNNGANAWAGFNHDATLLGNGVGTALGIDLAHANSWTGLQTFATVDINGGTVDGTIIGASVPAAGTFTNLTATGNIDAQGWIMNSTANNAQAVYINDYLQISNTISNPTLQNNGRVYVGDDFEVFGSVYLGGANTDNVYFIADVNSNIIPNIHNVYNLGSTTQRWHDIYFAGTLDGQDAKFVNLTVTGSTTLGDATTDPIILNGTITSSLGPVLINDAISQTGAGQVSFSGNVDALAGLDVTGATTMNGTLTQSGGQVIFNGNVDATNGLDITGLTTHNGSITQSSGTAQFLNTTVNGTFSQTGGGAVNISGPTTINNTLTQTGGGQVSFSGNVDALAGLDVTGATTMNGTLTQSGGQVIFNGNVDATNGLDITGLTTHNGSITQSSGTAQFLNTTVNGTFSQTGGGAVNISGPTTINNTLTQTGGGQVSFSGNVDANAGLDIIGLTTHDGNITQSTGTAQFLNTTVNGTFDQTGGGQVSFSGNVDATAGLDIIGLTTHNGSITQSTGTAQFLNTTVNGTFDQTGGGQVTFSGNVDANAGLDVSGADLTLTGFNIDMNENNIVDANIIDGGAALSINTSNNGTITTGTGLVTLNGNLIANANVTLGSVNTNTITATGTFNSDLIPNATNTYNLGSDALRWNQLYLNGGSLHLGASGDESVIGWNGTSTTISKPVYISGTAGVAPVDLNVVGDAQTSGNLDVNGYIMNNTTNNDGAVYINDWLHISNTISNPVAQNNGRVYVGDDFEVTGTAYLDSVVIGSALGDGSSFGANGQVPIANGAGNWAWQDVAGSFAIATDGITIVGDGTTANPIRTNDSIVTSSTPTFDAGGIASVFNYTGNNANLTILNPTTGRRIWVMHTAGTGNLTVAPSENLGVGTARSFIYSGTAWIAL